MTAISIDVLRESIHPPMKDERKDEDLWKFFDITNCYSYALGLLFDFRFLYPGEISKMERHNQYSDNELVERIKNDIITLGLEIRESTLEELVNSETSWKIAVLNAELNSDQSRYDYHFVKQHPNQSWYHKIPYDQFPTKYDSCYRTIENPATATYSFNYHLVGYFVITKIKKNWAQWALFYIKK